MVDKIFTSKDIIGLCIGFFIFFNLIHQLTVFSYLDNLQPAYQDPAVTGRVTFGVVSLVVAPFRAPNNIEANLNDDRSSIDVNWTESPGADQYIIYYSGNLSQLINLNLSSPGSDVTSVTGIMSNNWTDHTANISNLRYYRVSSIKDTLEKLAGQTVCKFTYSFIGNTTFSNAHLSENIAGMACYEPHTAESLLQDIGNESEKITRLVRQNSSSYQFVTHIRGLNDGKNFSLNLGEGYIITVHEPVGYTFTGEVNTSPDFTYWMFGNGSSVNAHRSENIVSLAFDTYHTAESFLQGIGTESEKITKLIRSSDSRYRFVTHIKGADDGKNFEMELGEGYILTVQNPTFYTINNTR